MKYWPEIVFTVFIIGSLLLLATMAFRPVRLEDRTEQIGTDRLNVTHVKPVDGLVDSFVERSVEPQAP